MHLAVFHPALKERGGAEKVVLEYCLNTDHKVDIFTYNYNRKKTFDSFQELKIHEISTLDFESNKFASRLINQGIFSIPKKLPIDEFDALLVSSSGVTPPIVFRNNNITTVLYSHTPLRATLSEFESLYKKELPWILEPLFIPATKIFKIIEGASYSQYDQIVCNSQTTLERLIGYKSVKGHTTKIVNPGTKISDKKSNSFSKYFFYPSRIRKYKRQKMAINAFKKANLDSDFSLIIAGAGQEEDYVQELRKMANNNISIEVDVPDERWKELYSNSYSIIFCAEKEDWGIVPIEAGAYEKPIIAVNEGGPKESIHHAQTGFLTEPNANALANRMTWLAQRPNKAKKMGKIARQNAKKYTWDNFASKLDSIIKNA